MSDIIQIFCEDKHHYQVLSHLLDNLNFTEQYQDLADMLAVLEQY